ncbi:transcription factor jumonji [Tieghemostelium lacteum]|uniref:Transcription factor jumonji n=1 Tax=Tieghemostelium lacteum TaxID=361077 RepID=A0A152A156_TIELA|nr:transcription factor jumonji [Tieghemostelium lacteum]|eukprot:KYQ99949.1 transcription factor jumonji [Tieghemostelium lacteum]
MNGNNEQQQSGQSLVESENFRNSSFGYFSKLVDKDLLETIFSEFTVEQLILYQGVSQGFYVMLNDDRLWKDCFLLQIKGRQEPLRYQYNWKYTAINYLYPEKVSKTAFPFTQLQFPKFHSMEIYTRWLRRHMVVKEFGSDTGLVDHVDSDKLTVQEFIDRYERPSIPVIFRGESKEWKANQNWTKEKLVERVGDLTFKITHQSHKRIPMKFKDYAEYMSTQLDEEPLYVFDEAFGEKAPDLLKDYKAPKYFPEDLFEVSGKERPHYRWIVIGPPRSGAPWHIDPAGTSAWNTLIQGKKRWLMYPPNFQPIGVHLEDISEKFYGSLPSLLWLLEVYPYLPPDNRPIECIQEAGETIFVPGGWWHMVLNLEESIAVTQNFCDSQNFNQVCEELSLNKNEYPQFKDYLLKQKPEYSDKIQQFEIVESQMKHSFENLKVWEPMVKRVYQKFIKSHSSEPVEVSPPISGQSPVFIVNKKFVVKFYCTEFGGEDAFQREVHLYSVLTDQLKPKFPQLLGKGNYVDLLTDEEKLEQESLQKPKEFVKPPKDDDKNDKPCQDEKCKEEDDKMVFKWKWPFIITSFIEGINLQEIQLVPEAMDFPYPPTDQEEEEEEDDDEPPKVDNNALVDLLAETMMQIHAIPLAQTDNNPFLLDKQDGWKSWKENLKLLSKKYRSNHYNWRGMPAHLAPKVDEYLDPKSLETLIDINLPPCYIHADLTDENVLGSISKKEQKKKIKQQQNGKKQQKRTILSRLSNGKITKHDSGHWKPEHFIDLGDSKYGDRWYELISLHLSIFAGDKKRFRQFLAKYKFSANDPLVSKDLAGKSWLDYYNQNPISFIKRAMGYTIIHHCDAFTTILRHFPEYRNATSMDHFAKLIWDLDYTETNKL